MINGTRRENKKQYKKTELYILLPIKEVEINHYLPRWQIFVAKLFDCWQMHITFLIFLFNYELVWYVSVCNLLWCDSVHVSVVSQVAVTWQCIFRSSIFYKWAKFWCFIYGFWQGLIQSRFSASFLKLVSVERVTSANFRMI